MHDRNDGRMETARRRPTRTGLTLASMGVFLLVALLLAGCLNGVSTSGVLAGKMAQWQRSLARAAMARDRVIPNSALLF